jgi:glycosyltransferase involved in cell wall biosynthesis
MSITFSIIVPHYDQSVSDAELDRCLRSIAEQTYRNYEVLLLHDGPPTRPLPPPPLGMANYAPRATRVRANDFGHSLRDAGIRLAKGDYIVHLNADNLLYPFALEELAATAAMPGSSLEPHRDHAPADVLVFPVVMKGVLGDVRFGLLRTHDPSHSVVLNGYPPLAGMIDCMQLVMKRAIWLEYGGWYDKSTNSDGTMYPRFIRERGSRMVGRVLGEHW